MGDTYSEFYKSEPCPEAEACHGTTPRIRTSRSGAKRIECPKCGVGRSGKTKAEALRKWASAGVRKAKQVTVDERQASLFAGEP